MCKLFRLHSFAFYPIESSSDFEGRASLSKWWFPFVSSRPLCVECHYLSSTRAKKKWRRRRMMTAAAYLLPHHSSSSFLESKWYFLRRVRAVKVFECDYLLFFLLLRNNHLRSVRISLSTRSTYYGTAHAHTNCVALIETRIRTASTHSSHFCACDFWSRRQMACCVANGWRTMMMYGVSFWLSVISWLQLTTDIHLACLLQAMDFSFISVFFASHSFASSLPFFACPPFLVLCRVLIIIRNGYGFVRACIFLFGHGLRHDLVTMCIHSTRMTFGGDDDDVSQFLHQ